MRDYLDQVEAASEANLYYLALSGALVVPDMAAAMDASDGRANGPRYVAWFDRYAAERFNVLGKRFLTGEDCWGLRCSILHEGRMRPHRGAYSRVFFVEPDAREGFFHLNVFGDVLNIDVGIFVAELVAAAREWLDQVEGTERYQQNFRTTMQRHPQGLTPLIGPPVIG